MQNVLLHYACPWEMEDERNPGTFNRGFSLQFVSPYQENRKGAVGFRGTKTSIRDEAVYETLKKLPFPVMADLILEAKPGPDGKLTAVVVGVSNVKPINLFAQKAAA